MANTAQAIKRDRQSQKRNALRSAQRSQTRTSVKKTIKQIQAGDAAGAALQFKATTKTLDTMAGKGVIHRNKAARLKSRLSLSLKKLANGAAAQQA